MSLWAQMDCGLRIVSVDSSYSVVDCLESCNLSEALIVQDNPQTVHQFGVFPVSLPE